MESPREHRGVRLFGMAACACAGVFVAAVSWIRIDSVDTGYHLAYGRYVLDHGRIVDRDPYLYPSVAIPFVNANWGSQVLMALAERAGGVWGLTLLRTLLVAVIFVSVAILVRRLGGGWTSVAAAFLLAGVAGYERFSLRPELFSYALLSILVVVLQRDRIRERTLAAVAVIQLLWVNLHSYFIMGVLVTAAWLAGHTVASIARGWSSRSARASPSPGRLATVLAVQMVACLVNPWHVHGAAFPVTTLRYLRAQGIVGGGPQRQVEAPATARRSAENAWSHISEFHSPLAYAREPINARTIRAYWAVLAVAAGGAGGLILRRHVGAALVIVLLAAMSFQMRRNIAQFALVASPLAIGGLAGAWRDRPAWAKLGRAVAVVVSAAVAGLSLWWAGGIAAGRFYYNERRITRQFGVGYSPRTFATGAAAWVAARPELQPELFVDYFSSSNVMPVLCPRFRLFVNTNTFACGERTLAEAFAAGLGEIDVRAFLDNHGVNVVLLHAGPDTQMMIRRLSADFTEWALVYFDTQAVVFVRRIVAHLPVIMAHQPSAGDLDAAAWIAALEGPRYDKAMSLCTAAGVPVCLGWWSAAVTLLDEAVRLAPDYWDAWQQLGACHANLGNASARGRRYEEARQEFEQAVRCFDRVLILRPGHAEAVRLRGRVRATLEAMPRQ